MQRRKRVEKKKRKKERSKFVSFCVKCIAILLLFSVVYVFYIFKTDVVLDFAKHRETGIGFNRFTVNTVIEMVENGIEWGDPSEPPPGTSVNPQPQPQPQPQANQVISFIGDSITTFDGCIVSGYATYYPSSNQPYGVDNPEDTWWKMVVDQGGYTLGANASWSGSTVHTAGDPARLAGNTDQRIKDLAINGEPGTIVIFMGTNDTRTSLMGEFEGQYKEMIEKAKAAYPNAKIYCCGLLWYKSAAKCDSDDANKKIQSAASATGATYIDLYSITKDASSKGEYDQYIPSEDDVHPTKKCMEEIAKRVLSATGGAPTASSGGGNGGGTGGGPGGGTGGQFTNQQLNASDQEMLDIFMKDLGLSEKKSYGLLACYKACIDAGLTSSESIGLLACAIAEGCPAEVQYGKTVGGIKSTGNNPLYLNNMDILNKALAGDHSKATGAGTAQWTFGRFTTYCQLLSTYVSSLGDGCDHKELWKADYEMYTNEFAGSYNNVISGMSQHSSSLEALTVWSYFMYEGGAKNYKDDNINSYSGKPRQYLEARYANAQALESAFKKHMK